MMNEQYFFNLEDHEQGMLKQLAPGLTARLFLGDNLMISVVNIEPFAEGPVHSHIEEQWGLMLSGTGVRIQDEKETLVVAGDFWKTPSGVSHGLRAGEHGARVLDIFSPPRADYVREAKG